MVCDGFSAAKLPKQSDMMRLTLLLSLAGISAETGEDVLIPEISLDGGRTWSAKEAILLQGTTSNARHEGFWRLPLLGIPRELIDALQVRLRHPSPEGFTPTAVLLDAVGLEATTVKTKKEPSRTKKFFAPSEEPTVFFDERTLQSVEILDAQGRPVDTSLKTLVTNEGTAVVIERGAALRPGTYIVRARGRRLFGSTTLEQQIAIGLANMNTPKAVYEPGDLVSFALGALDDKGKTVCDAALALRITKPDGTVTLLSTADGSIRGSLTCGPTSLTNEPDYSASLLADQQGAYQTVLEITTQDGKKEVRGQFDVQPIEPFSIERLAPTRINPKAPYISVLRVTPRKGFRGFVDEALPAGFAISNISADGKVLEDDDGAHIRWDAAWEAGRTYELRYTFDAPDVSPALFSIGPLALGDVTEPRTWTMTVDETVRKEKESVEYESLAVTDDMWRENRDRLALPSQQQFAAAENAHVVAFKRGYNLANENIPPGLDKQKSLTVTDVVVRGPNGEKNGVVRVSESFERGGKEIELLHLVPTRTFRQGVYTVVTTLTDGTSSVSLESSFAWGVLVLNTPKSVYLPGERVDFGMGVVDSGGNTVCTASMELVVTPPRGEPITFRTADGTITLSPECDVTSVTNTPDYAAIFTAGEVGEYALRLTATTEDSGAYSIDETLHVQSSVDVQVTRNAPTRVYPRADYDLSITLDPVQALSGTVEEFLPASYDVLSVGQGGVVERLNEDTTVIRWSVDIAVGERYELTYRVDPEDVSPALFRLGPAKVGEFTELRAWQIASDAEEFVSGRVWVSGFELQSITADVEWTAAVNTPVIDTTTKRSGAASLEALITGSASTEGLRYQFASADTADDYYFRVYVNVATYPSTLTSIITINDSAPSDQASIRMNTNGTLELWNDEDNVQVGSDSSALSTGTWYRIEVRVDATTIASTVLDARIDGASFASGTVDHANGVRDLSVGILATNATGEFNFDDIAINNDASSPTENWPGEGKIIHLKPNAAGANTCDASTYAVVDEVTPNDATDYITCDATLDVAEFNMEDATANGVAASDIIRSVGVGIRFTHADASDPASLRVRIKLPTNLDNGTTQSDSSASWNTNSASAPRNHGIFLYDQSGGTTVAPATPSSVDSMLAGVLTSAQPPNVWVSTIWAVVEYTSPKGGRLYSSGFELQSVTAGVEWAAVNGTLNIDTTTYRSGAASLRVQSLASGTEESVDQDFKSSNSDGPFYLRVYVYLTTAPSAENRIIEFQDSGGTARAYITLDNNRLLALYDEDGQVGSDSSAIKLSAWYRIEMKFDSSGGASADTIEGKINGVTFATSATRDLTNGVTKFLVGGNLNAEVQTTGDWYFDDIAINENLGSTENGYPGPGSITHLRPNAAGDNTAWTNAYTEVDEVTPNDASDVISSTTADQIEEVNLDSTATGGITSGDTIVLVSVGVRFNDTTTTQSNFNLSIRDNTGAPVVESYANGVASTTWMTHRTAQPRTYLATYYDRPLITTVWSTSALDTSQIGVRLTRDGGTNSIQVSTLWLMVEYDPPTTVVSGTIYSDDGSTAYNCSSNNLTVAVRVNGSGTYSGTCTAAGGTYSINRVRINAQSDIVTVFLDGETEKAVVVTRSEDDASNISLNVHQSRVIVTYEDSGPITNANLGTGDDGDTDIVYSVASNNLTVDSGIELHVKNGKTYTPGGTITTNATGGDFHIDDGATVTIDTATTAIGRDIIADNGATLNINATTTVSGGDITTAGTATVTTTSGTPTVSVSGTGTIGGGSNALTFYSLALSGTPTLGSNITVNANLTLPSSVTAGSTTVTMAGTGNLVGGGATLANLTIDGSTNTVTLQTSDLTVSTTLTVASGDALTLSSGRTLTLSGNSGTTLSLSGTLNGPGRLTYQNSATTFPTGGTLASTLITRFDTVNGNMVIPARTDYGAIEAYGGSANARTVTLGTAGSQTITASGYFYVIADAASPNHVTLQGATWDPTLNVGGDFDFTGTGAANEQVTAPDAAATWTVTGNVTLTDGTWTAGAETILMNGTANLIGNSQTIANVTINGSGNTVTLTTSDLSVSGTLTIGGTADGNDDTLSIDSGRSLTSTSSGTVTLVGSGTDTISGAGTLVIKNSNLGAAGTLSVDVQFNVDVATLTMPARTYGGDVSVVDSGNSGTLRMPAGTTTIQGNLSMFGGAESGVYLDGETNNPTLNVTGNVALCTATLFDSVSTGTGTWTVTGGFEIVGCVFTANSGNTIVMDGTADLSGGSKTLQNLTINGNGNTVTLTTSVTVASTLTIGASADGNNDTFSINSGLTLTSSSTGTVTLVGSGTDSISGSGTLRMQNSNLGTSGTIDVVTVQYFDADVTVPARAFGGSLEVRTVGTTRTVTMGAGTFTITGSLNLNAQGAGNMTLTGASNNPTVNLTGDLDFTGTGTGSELITTGTGTWTVSGNVDFTNGTATMTSGNTLVMNGSSKTLTSASQTLQNLTLSGSITLANATHTIAGNFSMAGGTITAGTSTVTMTGTSNTITGGSQTLNNLTIDPSSAGTITLQTTGMTVSGTLNVATGDTLTITTVTLTHSGTTLTLSGTISGTGRLIYKSSTAFPTGGTISSILRFDATNNNQTMSARTYGGNVEIVNTHASLARTVTMAAGTHTISGGLYLDGSQADVTLAGNTNNPTVDITGDLDNTGNKLLPGIEYLNLGTGTWTVSGHFDLDATTLDAGTSTVVMNGTDVFLTSNAQILNNLTISGGYVALYDAAYVGNDISLTGGTLDSGGSSLTIYGSFNNDAAFVHSNGTVTLSAESGTKTIDADGTGAEAFYNLVFNDSGGPTTFQLTTALDVDNNLTITGGTLDANGNNLTVGGNWDNDDAFTISTSTVTFNAASGTKTIDARGLAAPDFYSVIFNDGGGTAVFQLTTAFDANANVTITGGEFQANGNTINVAGNWTNNDIFTHGSSTVTADGAAQQTFAGTMTGSSSFNNLTITNSSGSDPDTSPSVIFSAAATTAGTFTATTASTKIRFNAGSTYTFQNISFSGQATGTRVFLRSSSNGTQWNLNVAGTRSVSYTNVRDSNACGQAPDIDASDGTNIDSTNNDCWTINSITFSISDTTIGFGALSSSAATWATGDTNGSASDTAAHTMNITANGVNGYIITYNGATLTSGGNTIDVASITNDADGTQGTEQFGVGYSTNGNATIATGYDHNATPANRDWTFAAGTTTTVVSETTSTTTETISAFYLGNIAQTTQPGSYMTNITYIATATF